MSAADFDEMECGKFCDHCSRTMPRGCPSKHDESQTSVCCRCHQKAPGVDGDDCDLCLETASTVEAINGLGGGHDAEDAR
jgi:hypothetical protein